MEFLEVCDRQCSFVQKLGQHIKILLQTIPGVINKFSTQTCQRQQNYKLDLEKLNM